MSEHPAAPDLATLTRQVFDAVDRHDFDAALGFFAPDAIWESNVVEARFEGLAAIRDFLERWRGAYEAFELQTEDIREFGNGVVLCVFMNRSRPSEDEESEPSLRFAMAIVWTEGLVSSVTGSEDIDEARATAERLAGRGA
jgi:ketosteroid isomerase-like protein